MTTFAIDRVSLTVEGVERAPGIGETFALSVQYTVVGVSPSTYDVEFTVGGERKTRTVQDLTPGQKKAVAFFRPPLDGPISWRVVIDPAGAGMDPTQSLASKQQKGWFVPLPPQVGIEFFEPNSLIGSQIFAAKPTDQVPIDRATVLFGGPTSESWQKAGPVETVVRWGDGSETLVPQPVENASEYPVYYWCRNNLPSAEVSVRQTFSVTVSNQRVNAHVLGTVTWEQLDAVIADSRMHYYVQPESVVQSNDPKVADFVTKVLGAKYRQNLKPYDAARRLFQAVLAHCEYFYPSAGDPDERAHDAVAMIETGIGDCGSFSLLLVALYRHIGFPARVAGGYWIGKDNSHAWSEMFFPGHGWLLSDGSAGNSLSEDGAYAYCFGNLFDLNIRYATIRGNNFRINDIEPSWLPWGPALEGPTVVEWHGATSVYDLSVLLRLIRAYFLKHGHIESQTLTKELDAADLSAAMLRRPADALCPCVEHSGLQGKNPMRHVPHVRL